jgi:hypothetical protein
LVSADFLASDFVVNNELPRLLHRAANGGLLILPLIIGPCLFSEHDELSRYQCVNSPDRPLSVMLPADAEAALLSLARSVDQYFRFLDSSLAPAPATLVPTPLLVQRPPSRAMNSASDRSQTSPAPDRPESSPHGPLVVGRPLNLGFDGPAPGGIPVGWFNSFGHVSGVSTDYSIRVVGRSDDRTAGTCAVLEKIASAPDEFGSLMERCPGRFLAGRTIRLEGELRTENVTGWAGLWFEPTPRRTPTYSSITCLDDPS